MSAMFISIGQVSLLIGVSVSTLRRWEADERLLPSFRTKGGHRRYNLQAVKAEFYPSEDSQESRINLCYARVSSADQKEDLVRQKQALTAYCGAKGWNSSLISDLGSGINYKKRGLSKLLKLLCQGSVKRLILTHKDRLLRFGSPLIFKICESYQTEIILIHEEEVGDFENELVRDVLEILTVYSARLYGRRSHMNRPRAA